MRLDGARDMGIVDDSRAGTEMTDTAGWEVEGFIARLTRRDGTNDERLVLEAISHLRAFSRDCDALRDTNAALREQIERLRADVDLWKSRWEAERADHETSMKQTDEMMREWSTPWNAP